MYLFIFEPSERSIVATKSSVFMSWLCMRRVCVCVLTSELHGSWLPFFLILLVLSAKADFFMGCTKPPLQPTLKVSCFPSPGPGIPPRDQTHDVRRIFCFRTSSHFGHPSSIETLWDLDAKSSRRATAPLDVARRRLCLCCSFWPLLYAPPARNKHVNSRDFYSN